MTMHPLDPHLHVINVIGAVVYVSALAAHLPSLAWYTAAVGAVWYTCLAVRQVIQSYQDIKAWILRLHK